MATHCCTSACNPVCTVQLARLGNTLNSTSSRITATGELWNGPRCHICGKGYIGTHECSPADILRKIADLYDRLPKSIQTDSLPPVDRTAGCPCRQENGGCIFGGPTITCSVA